MLKVKQTNKALKFSPHVMEPFTLGSRLDVDCQTEYIYDLEDNMKNKIAIGLSILALVLAALACQAPWNTPTPTETNIPTEETTLPPTETETEAPTETATEGPTSSLPVFSSPVIFDFSFFTPLQGWAVTQDGNNILTTLDGGQTWLDATPVSLGTLPSGVTSWWLSPFYLDANTAWVTPSNFGGGSATLYHTTDGGQTWITEPVPFDNARYFFLDQNGGYALVDLGAGAGSQYVALYQTIDGGANWTQVFTHEPGTTASLPGSGHKSGLTFLDMNHGWIGGDVPMTDYFYFYATVDGGANWALETDIALPAGVSNSFEEVQQPVFVGGTAGYLPVRMLTDASESYLLIYRTDDSGQTWVYQGMVQNANDVDFDSATSGWIAADMSLYRSTDSGMTWSAMALSGIPATETILQVDFVDGQSGWLLTTPDDSTWTPLNFYHTEDGGATWTQLLP